jgi:hypothetical protein
VKLIFFFFFFKKNHGKGDFEELRVSIPTPDDIGGDSECKVSSAAEKGGERQRAKSRERGRGRRAAMSGRESE